MPFSGRLRSYLRSSYGFHTGPPAHRDPAYAILNVRMTKPCQRRAFPLERIEARFLGGSRATLHAHAPRRMSTTVQEMTTRDHRQ